MIHFTGELAISGNMSERDQKIEFYYYNKIQKRKCFYLIQF